MSERGPIYKRLESIREASHDFFFAFRTPLKGMQFDEIEHPNPSQKRFLQSQTLRIVYACMETLTALNPGVRYTFKAEPAYDANYEPIPYKQIGVTGEEAA